LIFATSKGNIKAIANSHIDRDLVRSTLHQHKRRQHLIVLGLNFRPLRLHLPPHELMNLRAEDDLTASRTIAVS
jgi:hypothetical protein